VKLFFRTFNDHINSKTGVELPAGRTRGTPDWKTFEGLLLTAARELGHEVVTQEEQPLVADEVPDNADRRFYVHKCRRDIPSGDYFWMQMHLRELFTLDSEGWGWDHSAFRTRNGEPPPCAAFARLDAAAAREECEILSAQYGSTGVSKHEQPGTTSPTPDRFLLVPLQVPCDYTIQHHSPLSVYDFTKAVLEWSTRTQTHVGIKPHPMNGGDRDLKDLISAAEAESPWVHRLQGNIHELIQRAEGLLVINSGTGFEGLIHGKPVCTFGRCDYGLATFPGQIENLDSALAYICSYGQAQRERGYQFVSWYRNHHAFNVNEPGRTKHRLKTFLERSLGTSANPSPATALARVT